MTLWKETSVNLLKAYDFSNEEIEDLLEKRLELDCRIAAVVLSNEESSEYAKLYHPYSYEDFKKFAPALPLDDFFQDVLGQVPDKVIVDEERFWQAADQFYSEESWPLLKATLILSVVNLSTSYLTEEIRVLSGAYSRALSGVPEAKDKVKAAYQLAQGPFKQALGLWYAHEKILSRG